MTQADQSSPIRLGISGLGLAGAMMIRAARIDPRFELVAGADPLPRPRDTFRRDFGARTHDDFTALCEDDGVDAVYIASPHEYHMEQVVAALEHGKHVLVEKPLALTLADCDRVIAAADSADTHLIVGHTHGFDPNIRQIRERVMSGEMGRLAMILNFNYTDFLFRPRRPEELDTSRGGGITFNQVMHQIEIARAIGGAVRSVRANTGLMDSERPTEGNSTVFLEFETGGAATLIYSAYDFFDSDELHGWIAEGGNEKGPRAHGSTRKQFVTGEIAESARQKELGYGGRDLPTEQPNLPHFGELIVSCEHGDIRLSPDGLLIYGKDGLREAKVERGEIWAGQGDALDALWGAIRTGHRDYHDARWGKASVEIVLAILESARERREILLQYQR
ncbi:MAG: Gfo/Idh/MocA family oxidoreductase [Rhodospirillales bacterium]|nr:Gfo/Idh/MocA family oxidoreductase [Rhodospirillales bacterium]